MKKIIFLLSVIGTLFSFANERQGERGGHNRQPPQEAISVCQGEVQEAACQITTVNSNIVEGHCKNTPDNKYFACIPNHHRQKK
ncbi:MAG: hypothetical protein K0U47_05000 [Epsilonproteobacteria bacterium]|nr:hypothetical protein [Campylobacterota bacterium]